MTHALKTWPEYFRQIESRAKNFEIRKHDRPFAQGDTVILQEWDPKKEQYTMKEEHRIITYILSGAKEFGLMDGYCIFGMKEKESEY